jgi:hypothetical protein
VAAAVFIVGLVVFVRSVADGFDRIENPGTITLPVENRGIYAPIDDAGIGCSLKDVEGGRSILFESSHPDATVTIGGSDRHLIATIPEDVEAGNYVLECAGGGPYLWTGPEFSVARVFWGVALIFVVPGALMLAALVSLIVIVVKRHT